MIVCLWFVREIGPHSAVGSVPRQHRTASRKITRPRELESPPHLLWEQEVAGSNIVDDLYARAEGNPFTEQMVAAALASGVSGELRAPGRLEELLAARAGRCARWSPTAFVMPSPGLPMGTRN